MNYIKKAVAVVCCLLCVVTAIVPVSAATKSVSDTYITLDDGSRLFVPSEAVDGSHIIVRQTGRQVGSLIIEKTRYVIYSFDGWIGSGMTGGNHDIVDTTPSITEGDDHKFLMYKTDYFVSDFDALAADSWSYNTYSDKFAVSGDIVYSTVNYYSSDGSLIYGRSDDVVSDVEDPSLDDSNLIISPVRDYTGMLPPISSLTSTYKSNNWVIFRHPYSYELDDNGLPIYTDETEWRYQLYFFSDDYEIDFGYSVSGEGTENEKRFSPYIIFNAATTYKYDLLVSGGSDGYYYLTDAVLEQSGKNFYWGSRTVSTDACHTVTYGYLPVEMTSNSVAFKTQMSNLFVASSFPISQPQSGPWYTSGLSSATSYNIPAFSWSTTLFDLANGSTAEEEESGIIAWLQKIYNGMISGFERVIDAIGLGGGSDTSVDDIPDADENINPDEEDENGFSLSDIFGSLWEFVKKIFGGFWKLISSILGGITGFIGDFFDLITDSTSGLFDIFDDREPSEDGEAGAWYYIGNFFAFLQNLWLCIPSPIKALIYASFSILVVFGLFKMFH